MTLEEKEREYQQIIVNDYKRLHPEETEHLTDEEIALMNPLCNTDFLALIQLELGKINEEIVDVLGDINSCEENLKDIKVSYVDKPNIQSEKIKYENRLNVLRNKYDNLKDILLERQENERKSGR